MGLQHDQVRQLAERSTAQGDPTGWFEQFYQSADGDIDQVYWADKVANPSLVDWLSNHQPNGSRAIVIGCGLGDDVAYLVAQDCVVTGFDISGSAIAMCKNRYPQLQECFMVADLFALPADWLRNFDLVFECNTIQALSGAWRVKALEAIAELVAPEGVVLVSSRSRNTGEREEEFPLALDLEEIAGFQRAGLSLVSLTEYLDDQQPPFPHFFGCYQRPKSNPIDG